MANVLAEAFSTAQSLFRADIFEAAVIEHSGAHVIVRRTRSTQSEGPYRCLGAPPPIGAIVSIMRFGNRHVCLTHHDHQAFGGPRFVAADYSTLTSDVFITASPSSGDITISLSAAHPSGAQMTIKRVLDGTANSVFIDAPGGLVEGASEIELVAEGNSVILRKDGSNWWIVADY